MYSKLWNESIPWILVGLVVGAVLGAFNGFLINKMKLQPFIATLGTMSLYRGLAYVVTGGVPVTNVPDSYRNIFNGELVGGIRYYIIVMVVVFLVAHILLSKMRSGDYLYAVGGNEEAAKLSGVNVVKTKYIAYIFCGVCSAIAGMIMLASLGSAEATAVADMKQTQSQQQLSVEQEWQVVKVQHLEHSSVH